MTWKRSCIVAVALFAILLTQACGAASDGTVLSPAEPAPQAEQPPMIPEPEAALTQPTSSPNTLEQATAPAAQAVPAVQPAVQQPAVQQPAIATTTTQPRAQAATPEPLTAAVDAQGVTGPSSEAAPKEPSHQELPKPEAAADPPLATPEEQMATLLEAAAIMGCDTINTARFRRDGPCHWPTNFDDAGNITSVTVNVKFYEGQIPIQFARLPYLQGLHFYNQSFTGEFPTEFADLEQLTSLTIPDSAAGLCKPLIFTNIWTQVDEHVPTCGPEISALEQLITLQAIHDKLGAEFEPPSHPDFLSSTGNLNIKLDQRGHIIEIRLTGAHYDDDPPGVFPDEIADLPYLKSLTIRGKKLSGPLNGQALVKLVSLEYLEIDGTNFSGPIPNELGQLTYLKNIKLRENKFEGNIPTELGHLGNLTVLDLSDNQLTGEIPTEIKEITSLRALWLANNQLSGTVFDAVSNLNLYSLDLSGNQLQGPIPAFIGDWEYLRYLNLSNNQITGPIPPGLGNGPNLENLALSDNQLTGSIPPELGNAANLQYLTLSNNQLTGSIPPELGNAANLRGLDISNNLLESEVPKELGNLEILNSLGLKGNQLTGQIPPSILSTVRVIRYGENDGLCIPQATLDLIEIMRVDGPTC